MVDRCIFVLACLLMAASQPQAHAETGAEGWLRYAPLTSQAAHTYAQLPRTVVALSDSPITSQATSELVRGLHSMLSDTFKSAPLN